jgi:DinB family protein
MSRHLKTLIALHSRLEERFDRMEATLSRDDSALFHMAPEVSSWSVASQLHHLAAATGLMLVAVDRIGHKKSPAKEGGSVTTVGKLVLRAGRFPRGKGKAPAPTIPPESITRADLEATIGRSRETWGRTPGVLEIASTSSWRTRHPYFGDFGAEEWLKLAAIHADHHFRIIEDIDKTR